MNNKLLKAETTSAIAKCGAMAIVRTDSIERAKEIAAGCLAGGVCVMEISYTLPCAGDIISALKQAYPDMIIGAGTVLDGETARHAILHGADFVIAPNLSKEAAKVCNRYQIPYAPGCTSITEAVKGLEYGAAFVKAFPISDFYGPKLLKIFKTPIPAMPILASGGINLENLETYVRNGADCCGFGSLLTKGSQEQIAKNAAAIRQIIDQTRKSMES